MDENILESHNEKIDPEIASTLAHYGLLASLVLFFASLCVCSWKCERHRELRLRQDIRSRLAKRTAVFYFTILFSFFLFIVASSIAKAYERRLKTRDVIDYQGKMRVTGVRYETRLEDTRSEKAGPFYDLYYDAIFAVDWGYEWACPRMDQTEEPVICNNDTISSELIYFSSLACDSHESCPDAKVDKALKNLMALAESIYDPAANYTPYDPFVGPSNDVDWPSIIAYGDCDTCSARVGESAGCSFCWDIPSNTRLRRMRVASISCAAVAAFILLLSPILRKRFVEVEVTENENDGETVLDDDESLQVESHC